MDVPSKSNPDTDTSDYEFYRADPGSEAREEEDKFLKSVGIIGRSRKKAGKAVCPTCRAKRPVLYGRLDQNPYIQAHVNQDTGRPCPGATIEPEDIIIPNEMSQQDKDWLSGEMKIKGGYQPIKFLAVPLEYAERVASALINAGIDDFDADEAEDLAVGKLAYFYFSTEDEAKIAANLISQRFAKQIAGGRGGWEAWRMQENVLNLHDRDMPKRKTLLSRKVKQAGQWGDRSYDSDQAHNFLDRYRPTVSKGGGGFDEPVSYSQHPFLLRDLSRLGPNDDELFLGVVVFLLSHGSSVPTEMRQRAEKVAERILSDEEYMLQWKDPAARRNALQKELALVKVASYLDTDR
jgi:hypothetical protein